MEQINTNLSVSTKRCEMKKIWSAGLTADQGELRKINEQHNKL